MNNEIPDECAELEGDGTGVALTPFAERLMAESVAAGPTEPPPAPELRLPPLCAMHFTDLMRRKVASVLGPTVPGEDGPLGWKAILLAVQILLFRAASADKVVRRLVADDFSKLQEVLKVRGCMACRHRDAYHRACEVAQGGIDHALRVGRGEQYDGWWPPRWGGAPAPEGFQ